MWSALSAIAIRLANRSERICSLAAGECFKTELNLFLSDAKVHEVQKNEPPELCLDRLQGHFKNLPPSWHRALVATIRPHIDPGRDNYSDVVFSHILYRARLNLCFKRAMRSTAAWLTSFTEQQLQLIAEQEDANALLQERARFLNKVKKAKVWKLPWRG